MPLELRKRWPVIVNKKGIVIYVPRYQPDFVPTKKYKFLCKISVLLFSCAYNNV